MNCQVKNVEKKRKEEEIHNGVETEIVEVFLSQGWRCGVCGKRKLVGVFQI